MCRWDQKGGGDTELEQGSGYVDGVRWEEVILS